MGQSICRCACPKIVASTYPAMGTNDVMPTGLKGKLASLEDFISMQNEELAAQRQEIESLRNDKSSIEEHYQGTIQEMKKAMVSDIQRLQTEVKSFFHTQK